MIRLETLTDGRVEACARMYAQAYAQPPWNETHDLDKVEAYLRAFMRESAFHCYVLTRGGVAVAMALCIRIPYMDVFSLRVEDLCVAPQFQRRGFGGKLLGMLRTEAARLGADCVLLGTQRDFPAHAFYLKHGFTDVDGAALMYCGVE